MIMAVGTEAEMNVITVRELIAELQKYPPDAIIERHGEGELLSKVIAVECRQARGEEIVWMQNYLAERPEDANIVALEFERQKGTIRYYLYSDSEDSLARRP